MRANSEDCETENELELNAEEKQIQIFEEWYEENKEINKTENVNETIEGITIKNIQKFFDFKKFHIRDFHYPTYEELMNGIEKLNSPILLYKNQYLNLLKQWMKLPNIKNEFKLAFILFDTEKRDFITVDELRTILTTSGDVFNESESLEILRDADVWGHGNIKYTELIESMFDMIPEMNNLKVEYLYENADEDPSIKSI